MKTKDNITEEVDIGQLFKPISIRATINKVYSRIFNRLNSKYNLYLLFVLFFKTHFIKFCFVAILLFGIILLFWELLLLFQYL